MDKMSIFLLVLLGISPVVLFFCKKRSRQKREDEKRLTKLRSNFAEADGAFQEWVDDRDFFEHSDSEYQRLLKTKIFHLKQLVFFKGKPTPTEKVYLTRLQEMETPPKRQGSD